MKLRDLAKAIFEEDRIDCDVTTQKLGKFAMERCAFVLRAKATGVFSGASWCDMVSELAPFELKTRIDEGSEVSPGQVILEGSAQVKNLLSIERSFLNVLQQLCGVASTTRNYVKIIQEEASRRGIQAPDLLHTRKTLPMLRDLQIEAVLAGGGKLHRRDLSERAMFKDNHKELVEAHGKSFSEFLKETLSENEWKSFLIEADDLEEARSFAECGAKNLLLDNFTPIELTEALSELKPYGLCVEVSGGINHSNVSSYVLEGVHRISVGALTHSIEAFDISLEHST